MLTISVILELSGKRVCRVWIWLVNNKKFSNFYFKNVCYMYVLLSRFAMKFYFIYKILLELNNTIQKVANKFGIFFEV